MQSAPDDQPPTGRFRFCPPDLFCRTLFDYDNAREQGVVMIKSLPAGEYEIYNFSVYFNTGTLEKTFSSREDISIPFTVKPGVTAYLGNYQANGLSGKNFIGVSLPAGAVFVVEDRLGGELKLAQSKEPGVSAETNTFLPDVERLGSPFFIAPD